MTKHQHKFSDPYTKKRRRTFKEHSKRYRKVYYPYLPAILISILSLSIFFTAHKSTDQVLSAATDISANRLLLETNEVRQENGSSQLKYNDLLGNAAQYKADDMVKRDYWSHTTPDGKEPWQFITKEGYSYSVASENLAFGFDSAAETVDAWMKSESHRKAMLDKTVQEVGFGVSTSLNYQDKGAQTIIVAMYASPQHSVAAANSDQNLALNDGQKVSFAQSVSFLGNTTTSFIVGILFGGMVVFLIIKNIVRIRREYKQGKRFILHHPAFDAAAVSIILLVVAISQASGFIQ